ncbi:MAG: quinolinate synthase NadA [Myxococcota bacterium]
MSSAEIIEKINELKSRFNKDLIILTHHYQRPEIVSVGDEVGDSYILCKKAYGSQAKYIVFCGVRFMAESAEILRNDYQMVFHPEPFSGCPMADMAESEDVIRAFEELDEVWGKNSYTPIVYMNSSAEVKSLAGMRDGIICTSSNAAKIISYIFNKGKKVIFIPDEYLGFNTYKRLSNDLSELSYWDYSLPYGGNRPEELRYKRYLIWKGYCHVHSFFNAEHIKNARREFKDCKIVVHPECRPEVVDLADAVGSTEFIVNYVKDSPKGTTIVIGTELNLVRRLASTYKDKVVVELARSMCPNMFKITLNKLKMTLERLPELNRVIIPDNVKEYSRLALKRMLDIVG